MFADRGRDHHRRLLRRPDGGDRPGPRGHGRQAGEAGLACARGRYIVIGDADNTYDFLEIPKLLARLDAGADMALGSRLRGEIKPGAMPARSSCRRAGRVRLRRKTTPTTLPRFTARSLQPTRFPSPIPATCGRRWPGTTVTSSSAPKTAGLPRPPRRRSTARTRTSR
ncbi:MAG TPA: glycosyltransferase [Methanoculleus sp.]|nr:glycosyltransferase [Methanoculleus sp.]